MLDDSLTLSPRPALAPLAPREGAPPPAPLLAPPLRLGRDDLERLLPHRDPMRLVAEALWVEPGRRGFGLAVDLAAVDVGLPSPGEGFAPWALGLEALAQLGAVVAMTGEPAPAGARPVEPGGASPAAPAAPAGVSAGPRLGFLASIPELRVLAPPRAGQPCTLEVEVVRARRGAVLVRAVARSGAERVIEARLVLALARG